MTRMDGVSVIIPCYNPKPYLLESVASARAQTIAPVEILLVDDGTDDAVAREIVSRAADQVDHCITQPNRGLAAARNAGFCAASYSLVVPLDADDLLEPDYVVTCLEALKASPDAAFAYTDYRVFGLSRYIERLPDYNLYHLINRNILTYAAVIRKSDWEQVGRYDETLTRGYEDWEFWLRLGLRGRFGVHCREVKFAYRKHGPSLFDTARAHHDEIVSYIRSKHPELCDYDARAAIKALWAPAVCIVGSAKQAVGQTIRDCTADAAGDFSAAAFLIPAASLDSHSAEFAALAVWSGKGRTTLPDGSLAYSPNDRPERQSRPRTHTPPPVFQSLHRHFANAELLSWEAWLRHPLRSLTRLIPLRVKEAVNRSSGRDVFDLSFYLRFQPTAIAQTKCIIEPLVYMPHRATRRRIGLVTPHLGPGGAEAVLLDVAAGLGRTDNELFLLTMQSQDDRWLERWRERVDHIYDLEHLVGFDHAPAALLSVAVNWQFDAILIQNALGAYSVAPHLKERIPNLRLFDLIHAATDEWDIALATKALATAFTRRIVVSETLRNRLVAAGLPSETIQVIRNGVDPRKFAKLEDERPPDGIHRILFAGRLDPVKRPLLLVDIAGELAGKQRLSDFRIVVAGDGPLSGALLREASRRGLSQFFEFRGHLPAIAAELNACDLLVLPSSIEGLPLVVLETFASARPVVASAVGALAEVVTDATGVLIPMGKGEVQAFAAAIAMLLKNPELRRKLGENGRRLVETSYTCDAAQEGYRALLTGNGAI